MPSYFSILIVFALSWGAFTFGATSPWAYVPLFWANAALGVLGLAAPGTRGAGADSDGKADALPCACLNWPVVCGLVLVAAAITVQLIPLAPETIAAINPATDRFLAGYDVRYAMARSAALPSYRHPLSIDPHSTWVALAALAALGLLLAGVSRGLGRRSLEATALGLILLGALLAVAGMVQSAGARDPQQPGVVYIFWKPIRDATPFGPFINRNHFAGWMLLALPVAVGYLCALVARGMRGVGPTLRHRVLWFSSPDASRVILVGLAVAVMGLSLVLTLSRSGITGFLLAVAISSWFVVRRQRRGSKRAVSLAYLALLVTLSIGWAGVDAVAKRFADAKGTGLNGRLGIWEDTIRVVRDFPLTGTGAGTYAVSMLRYQRFQTETATEEAHNDYLQLAAEGGVLVGIPALVLALILAREIRRRFREGADDATTYWLRVGATTGLVAIALQESVEFSLQVPGIAALFAAVAGIAIHRPGPRMSPGLFFPQEESRPANIRRYSPGDTPTWRRKARASPVLS